MKELTRILVGAVRAHAKKHYETGGWDYVVEAYDDQELAQVIEDAGATTPVQAIKAVGDEVGLRDEIRRDVQAS